MCFAWPEHFGYLLLLIPLAVLFGYGYMRQMQARERLVLSGPAGSGINGSAQRVFLVRRMLQFTGIALLLISLAGPQLCRGNRVTLRKGADLVFMLDVSNSMLARDVLPDRLEAARDAALRIGGSVREGRRALLLFAGSPLVQCPLTYDREAFSALLGMATPALIEEQGTSFLPAVELALKLFTGSVPLDSDGTAEGERIVVLLSDGEDHEGATAAAAAKLRRNGVSLFVLGFGSRNGADIPDPRRPGLKKLDGAGRVVTTRFSPQTLRQLASASGGFYFEGAGGDAVYDEVALRIDRIVSRSRLVSAPLGSEPLYHYFLGAGMLLLLVERALHHMAGKRQ